MKKILYSLVFLLSGVWGQPPISGTGLELEPLDGFEILVEDMDSFTKNIGLTESYIETKTKLALRTNGTPPTRGESRAYLYININILENTGGYIYNIDLQFNRPVHYVAFDINPMIDFPKNKNIYYKYGVNTFSKSLIGSTPTNGALQHISNSLISLIDQFSIALLEANEK